MIRSQNEIRSAVRAHYGEIAKAEGSCCSTECCTPEQELAPSTAASQQSGEGCGATYYTDAEKSSAPEGSRVCLRV